MILLQKIFGRFCLAPAVDKDRASAALYFKKRNKKKSKYDMDYCDDLRRYAARLDRKREELVRKRTRV